MSAKTIIFDFDGTIADNRQMVFRVINSLAAEFGYKRILKHDVVRLRNKKAQDFFKGIGISIFKLPFIVRRIRKELHKEIDKIKLVKGIKEALDELANLECRLGILTSNSEENIRIFLKNNNLELFNFIYSGTSLFGKDKVLKSLIKELKLNQSEVIYVGDETRDIEAARKVGIKVIAVGWGFNLEDILRRENPDCFIRSPDQLVEILESV